MAVAAGVSKSLVSRAFVNPGNVGAESLEKIMNAASDLGFRPSWSARTLNNTDGGSPVSSWRICTPRPSRRSPSAHLAGSMKPVTRYCYRLRVSASPGRTRCWSEHPSPF
ncbi:LacI family DNA-binding transcriptional regulator [Mycolicibacterium fortuitum]|nr:LacI family DNA-binding transcriptional regulator [Mycolicibacterium fortuitum]